MYIQDIDLIDKDDIIREEDNYNRLIEDENNGKKFPSVEKQVDMIERFFKTKIEKINPFSILSISYDSSDFIDYYLDKKYGSEVKNYLDQVDTECEGSTLLGACISLNLTSIFYTLIDKGAKLEVDNNNVLPILAVENNNFELLKYLIDTEKVDINKVDIDNNNIIHAAIKRNNENIIKYVLNHPNLDKNLYYDDSKKSSPKSLFNNLKKDGRLDKKIVDFIENFEKENNKNKYKIK